MRVNVVGAMLRVVFENEDSSVVPVRAVRDSLHDTANCQIIVRDRSGGAWHARLSAVRVVVGKIEQDELRQLSSLAFLARAHKSFKLVQKFVGAELIGILSIEIWKQRIEVIAPRCLHCLCALQHRDGPWPWARRTVRLPDV